MRTYFGPRAVDVDVKTLIRIDVRIEPGLWVVWDGPVEYTVVTLQAAVSDDGVPHLSWPKGLVRGQLGWAGPLRLLESVVPRGPAAAAWNTIPENVRGVIEDAYFLARSQGLPTLFGDFT